MTLGDRLGVHRHEARHRPETSAAPTLVLLHGFTQNARTWGGAFMDRLVERRSVAALDLPGHGDSSAIRADLWETAALVADAVESPTVRHPADFLGYSLGGRVLLHLLVSRPDVARSAILVGATAGIDSIAGRAERSANDEKLAAELDSLADDGVELRGFLERWLSQPLFARLDGSDACIESRMLNHPSDLASSLRCCGTGTQQPLWDRLGEISVPVLVLAGEHDEKFTLLGRRLVGCIGSNAEFASVPECGHSCQLERPGETAAIVDHFLEGLPSITPSQDSGKR